MVTCVAALPNSMYLFAVTRLDVREIVVVEMGPIKSKAVPAALFMFVASSEILDDASAAAEPVLKYTPVDEHVFAVSTTPVLKVLPVISIKLWAVAKLTQEAESPVMALATASEPVNASTAAVALAKLAVTVDIVPPMFNCDPVMLTAAYVMAIVEARRSPAAVRIFPFVLTVVDPYIDRVRATNAPPAEISGSVVAGNRRLLELILTPTVETSAAVINAKSRVVAACPTNVVPGPE
jgi:hypothetical protein